MKNYSVLDFLEEKKEEAKKDTVQDKDIKDRKGSQPKKYYKGLAKSTKEKRATHFKKGAEMSDDDPRAYKKAPGDARAKTKESEYTKKYKEKFEEQTIEEGVYDPSIFKAVFMAGGPGSGKSYVSNIVTAGLGMKVVNSDDVFEIFLKKAGMTTTPEDIFSDKGQEIRGNAKNITGKKMQLYIQGRLGLLIDGTGKDYENIKKKADRLRDIGYDTYMVFVNTSLEIAQERNANRSRKLDPKEVEKMWRSVQENIGKFQKYFGARNMIIVDNNSSDEKYLTDVYKQVKKLIQKPVQNRLAKNWISTELENKKNKMRKEEVENDSDILLENPDKSLKKKAEKSGIAFSILKQVYNRGVAAWRTGHRPGTTPEQWGHARVNSFIVGGKTRTTADADLWKKHKGK